MILSRHRYVFVSSADSPGICVMSGGVAQPLRRYHMTLFKKYHLFNKKLTAAVCVLAMTSAMVGCGSNASTGSGSGTGSVTVNTTATAGTSASGSTTAANGNTTAAPSTATASKKALVIYFNYSDNVNTTGMSVDAISSASLHGTSNGNAENLTLMANEIASKKNADVYKVRINEQYAASFDEMTGKARDDISDNVQFTFKDAIPDLSSYDVVYVGAPVWWYGLPQPMKVFISQIDLAGKTVVPFGIHRGSGFSGIPDEYQKAWPDATVVDGFTINADTANTEVKSQFDSFLDGLNY